MKVFSYLMLLALVVALPFVKAQDTEDPHYGQPSTCNNYYTTAPEHKCHCAKAEHNCDESDPDKETQLMKEPGKLCLTYCRPNDCHCISPCTT